MSKINVEIAYRPFYVPEDVRLVAGQGDATNANVPLAAVHTADLARMCDEWRVAVFATAGKVDPRLT